MERVQQAELTNEHFSAPADFGIAARLGHAWGISYVRLSRLVPDPESIKHDDPRAATITIGADADALVANDLKTTAWRSLSCANRMLTIKPHASSFAESRFSETPSGSAGSTVSDARDGATDGLLPPGQCGNSQFNEADRPMSTTLIDVAEPSGRDRLT